MKSTWVAAGLLLLTICQAAKDEPTVPPTTTPAPVVMTIAKIVQQTDVFQVCVNISEPIPATNYTIVIDKANTTEFNEWNSIQSINSCIGFNGDILTNIKDEDIFLVMKAFDGDHKTLATSTTDINPCPGLPVDTLDIQVANDPGKSGFKMLRVVGDEDGMEFDGLISGATAIKDTTTYYLEVETVPDPLILCKTTTPKDVKVCATVETGTPIESPGPDVESATLSYTERSATVSITTKSEQSTSMEVIITDGTQPRLFISSDLTLSETLNSWTKGEDTVHIRVIGINKNGIDDAISTNTIKEINSNPIQDRGMTIQVLDNDVLEGGWLMHKQNETQIYRLTLIADKKNLENVKVDCKEVTTFNLCFGYFPHVPDNDYTLTVTNIWTNDTVNLKQQIESISATVSTPVSSKQHLQIHDLPMEWHQNLMEVNTTICFSHETPNEEMIFSHYEMLLINTRGQWLKHKVMEEDDNDDVLCFTPFTINTQELDVTEGVKVVVSQRASDGFSVIASGGSTLF